MKSLTSPSLALRTLLPLTLLAAPFALAAACSAASNNASSSNAGEGGGASAGSGESQSSGFITDGGPSGPGSFGDANCGASTYANAVPASVLVVLDRSGSMSGDQEENIPDKWAPTVKALNLMMQSAPPELNMGLYPFPAGKFNYNGLLGCLPIPGQPMSEACKMLYADGGCKDVEPKPVVDVGPLSATQAPISSWLSKNGPNGNTPTLHALTTAYNIMRELPALGERYVLLMTDGEPNTHQPPVLFIPESNVECKTLADIEAETLAASMGSPPVKTFVIGSPGSEGAGQFLSQLAINGLTKRSDTCTAASKDCHYQIGTQNFQKDLEQALDEIAGAVSDCVFAIPKGNGMVDPNLVNVVVETSSGVIEVYKDTSHTDGWDYTDTYQDKVEIFGATCAKYQAEKGAKVSIILGCETVLK